MTKKKKYEERKRLGLCPSCGKNPHAEGKVLCQTCLDNARKDRDYKRKHHICVKCGSNRAAPNRNYCDDCIEWRHNRYERLKESKKITEAAKLYEKRHTEERKQNNLCVWCGKPSLNGKTLCSEHLVYYRNYMRRKRAFENEYTGD